MKVGWIDFLNTLPFDFGITGVKPDVNIELVKGRPSDINRLIRENKIDIGFISSAEYIQNFDKYLIFPDLSISALNKVHSVAIFSNVPVEDISTVYLTKASKTSRFLTFVVFKEIWKKDVEFRELEDTKDIEKKSVLLIGDNAIEFKDRFSYVYDLSAVWYRETKLPFVFALWCVREEFYQKNKQKVNLFYNTLKLSKEKFFKNPEFFVEKSDKDIDKGFSVRYLKSLDYCLSEEHMKSLNMFSSYLKKLGLIDKTPLFRFIK